MMTHLQGLKEGICAWMDDQILSKCSGLNKWMMGMLIMQVPMYTEKMYHEYKGMMVDMGIATDDDRIDIDKAEELLYQVASKYGRIDQKIAGVSISLGPEDVTNLAAYIKRL